MEPDKNMGLFDQKTRDEIPSDWAEAFKSEAFPFHVIQPEQSLFRSWTTHLSTAYVKKCPFKCRPIREIKISKQHPRLMKHRSTYHELPSVIKNPHHVNNRDLEGDEF